MCQLAKYFVSVLIIATGLLLSNPSFSQTITNQGTDFWIAFPRNDDGSMDSLSIIITGKIATSGSVFSAFPGVNQAFTVTPGIVTFLNLPTNVHLLGGIENKGIRITSNDPINVYGLNYQPYTTDAYLALPVNALQNDYWVITYKDDQFSNNGSAFGIVSTQDGTNVTIFNHQTNGTSNIILDAGETYYFETSSSNQDVTGSTVHSDHPVGVFGSVKCAEIPSWTCTACDHIVEMMFPHSSWGKNYLTIPLAGRNKSGDIYRVLAAEDTTIVTINGLQVATLNSGDYYQADLTTSNSITASKAVTLAQFAKGRDCSGGKGDPFMMLIPPNEQFLKDYTVISLDGFSENWINVVAPSYALGTIYQDGILIPDTAFHQIWTTNFYGAQRLVAQGAHTFTGAFPFQLTCYGWNYYNSYGYPGGCSMGQVGTVQNVTLSPDTSYGVLNTTNVCLTAHVTDNFAAPVSGILVTFNISGINPVLGTAYTDPSGNAVYCYTQTGTTPGTDQAYADVFGIKSDTTIVIWSYVPPCVNPTMGGSIGNDQTGCDIFTPVTLNNLSSPSGYSGNLEYKWQSSTTGSSSGFTDITATNFDSYSPGPLPQTTWFKRLARVDCSGNWTGAAQTNVVMITVSPYMPVSVSISGTKDTVCAGTPVTFSATPTNGGSSPVYLWLVNSSNAGTNADTLNYAPANGDVVSCVLTSSNTVCPSNNPATSNSITMTVNPNLPVNVTISASQNPSCAGTPVHFTAAPTNGGLTPHYLWKVNGGSVGFDSTVYTYIPLNGDLITCTLTSSELCTTNNPSSSIQYPVSVSPNLPVSVTVSASQNPSCAGTTVHFTATPTHGGTTPHYSWKVNGGSVGFDSTVYSYVPVNGDMVSVILTSSEVCTMNNPASSIQYPASVSTNLPVGVSITVSQNPFCPGASVTFSATPANGGGNPTYLWKVNGATVGGSTSSYTYNPITGDSVRCIMQSNLPCVTNNPASSSKIIMSGTLAPIVSFTPCFDTITTLNAKPIKLKGGIPLGGTYSGPGVNSITGVFTPSLAGLGTKTISYSYTNVSLCTSISHLSIVVSPSSFVNCGNPLTDIRDNKVYKTVQIGTQCWFAEDLNYGSEIPFTQNQRDNCIAEYFRNASRVTRNAFYQWDELMQYDDTPAEQGLCPPAWHVPTENDWLILFSNYTNNAMAGSPLKYSGYSGFNALLQGANHLNHQWDYPGFATFYWSSTSHGPIKAWAHGMNDPDPSVSSYPSVRTNAFSVRCIKD